MLKIYNPGKYVVDNLQGCYYKNFLPFDIEKKDFKHVSDIKDADVLAINGHSIFNISEIHELIKKIKLLNLNNNQKLLFMNIFHLDHSFDDKASFMTLRKILEQEIPNEFAIVHTNSSLNMEIYYDFLWNRQKIYFTNYNFIELKNRLYVHNGNIKNFELSSIEKFDVIHAKKYLCPNRIYNFNHSRLRYRQKIKEFIQERNTEGFFSDPFNGIILECENKDTNNMLREGGWYPIANHYYKNSYFSMFVETVTGQFVREGHKYFPYKSITEKTWDPLIKGHFILPFGYQGLIDHIKTYGFKFPDWIDYSYDMIEDNDSRFDAFLNSAEKLLDLSINELDKLYKQDKDILVHNREVFWDRPYDSLHDKVVKYFANYTNN